MPDNSRKRNLEDFSLLLFSRNSRYHHCIVKPMEKIFKEFCKGFPTIVGQQRKVCFAELLKYLFHYSVNRFFKKHKHRKEKHLQSMANFFQENVAMCASCLQSWLTGLILRIYMYNDWVITKVYGNKCLKNKSANYLHLQPEQLSGTCKLCLRKN